MFVLPKKFLWYLLQINLIYNRSEKLVLIYSIRYLRRRRKNEIWIKNTNDFHIITGEHWRRQTFGNSIWLSVLRNVSDAFYTYRWCILHTDPWNSTKRKSMGNEIRIIYSHSLYKLVTIILILSMDLFSFSFCALAATQPVFQCWKNRFKSTQPLVANPVDSCTCFPSQATKQLNEMSVSAWPNSSALNTLYTI